MFEYLLPTKHEQKHSGSGEALTGLYTSFYTAGRNNILFIESKMA